MSSEELRYQIAAAEQMAGRLRQDEKADPTLIAAFEALASDARQRLGEVASQPIARDADATSAHELD